jgi:hypothetical protein
VMAHARERLEPEMRAVDPTARIVFEEISEFPGLETPASREVVGLAKRLAGRNEHGKVAYGTEAGLLPWPASRLWSSARARSTRHTRPMSTLRCRSSKRAAPSSTGSSRIRAPNLGSCMRYRAVVLKRSSHPLLCMCKFSREISGLWRGVWQTRHTPGQC